MTALLPSLQAERVRRSLVDYVSTTFALADAEPRRALAEFLEHPENGIFKGPYVRLRLPFRPADDSWREALDWTPPFPPYRHQAEAYKRLTSKNLGPDKPRPLPTVVTTGTGSGKTEAFLHPILDHCIRARRNGQTGMKALILYPMNALADDQARRLTALLTEDPALATITAGLYTGDARAGQPGQGRTKVSPEGLITHRAVLRDDPPDILLTNYKMLDQLLLRPEDQLLWAKSWESLTYLVLDEFHTYDGAQGTDVAILLRRLGMALRSHVPADHLTRDLYEQRPLGNLTPVATSATLGDSDDPRPMLDFAGQVFGEPFAPDAAITERRVDIETLTASAREAVGEDHERKLSSLLAADIADVATIGIDHAGDQNRLLGEIVRVLYKADDTGAVPDVDDATLLRSHSGVRKLVELAAEATHVDDLVRALFTPAAVADMATARRALASILAGLSIIRLGNRDAVSVDVTLWLRELTRVDRVVSSEPGFRWTDDGVDAGADTTPALPAVFCRACGRSGWGVTLKSTGRDLGDRDQHIRGDHMSRNGRFRALLHAPGEAAAVAAAAQAGDANPHQAAPHLRWLHLQQRTILWSAPADDDDDLLEGRILPVVMLDGENQDLEKRSRDDECPSCGRGDQIRFLGSAIATLLSVSLSTLFGDPDLDAAEKRSLVFTDSVQDAAHRAGFVDHRSHTMSLRTALRRPLTQRMSLPDWVDAAMRAAEDDPFARYRLVPASLIAHPDFEPYWTQPYPRVSMKSRTAVRRRLAFDAALEVGLQTGYGRTLEATGSIGVHVSAGRAADLTAHGRAALGATDTVMLDEGRAVGDQALRTWVRGILEHMRRDGAIDHPWLTRYLKEDGNRHWIWGGRRRDQGAPAFPRGRSAHAFPVAGGTLDTKTSAFVPLTSPRSWYARWASKCLGVPAAHGASLSKHLFARLAEHEVLSATPTASGGIAYGIPPERVMVGPLSDAVLLEETTLLVCDTCRSPLPVSPIVGRELQDGPCLMLDCRGHLQDSPRETESFYRGLFAASDMRRVDAREHTSVLDATERREIEAGFKRSEQRPGDPNVLVATPTLEMGIDIGDLSTVMLSSLPDSLAKYQQRVGRGGRLTGSSLSLAYVTGRGENLPRLGEPTSMINGAVRPPATYLDAEEILQRQFIASVIDRMVRQGYASVPRTAGEVLASADPGTLLGDVILRIREDGRRLLEEFVAAFADPQTPGLAALEEWVLGTGEAAEDGDPRSAEATIVRAVGEHTRELEDLRRRRQEVEESIPPLREQAERPAATDEDKRALRSAIAGSRLIRQVIADLTIEESWIGGLELRGLLPNYSLMDDSVQLDAQVSWIDPDTQQFDFEPLLIDRGSSRALTELAPGAYFYARRFEMRVDGVELGQDNADVQTHIACDTCGFVAVLASPGDAGPRICPRCGSAGIAETGQRFDAAKLVRVFSDIRRDDALIGDNSDERRRTRFEIVLSPDFDPARRVGQWSVESVGLGVAHYRRMTVRWFNVGREVPSPHTVQMAGRDVTAHGFLICEACGKLDSGSGANDPREHRAWCRHRRATDEHSRSLALSRELATQGVAISLPPAIVDDMHSVHSLSAALQLGLREVMGGAPDHLRVEIAPHPVDDAHGEVRQALFLHDTVPGGTGYLTELSTPERLWPILTRAAQVLETCPCAEEGRGSCHRCLAPFGREVYRIDALRALRSLLGVEGDRPVGDLDPEAPEWAVTQTALTPETGESRLEQQFRRRFTERLAGSAQVTSNPTAHGPALTITGLGERVWFLQSQVDIEGARPDFVLSTAGVPKVVIFADGHAFHATPAINRLADDAIKRERLRAHGYRVLAVTASDLDDPAAPDWLNPVLLQMLMGQASGQAGSGISRSAIQEHEGGVMTLIDGLLRDPESTPRTRLSDALALLLGAQQERNTVGQAGADVDLPVAAAEHLLAGAVPDNGGMNVVFHRRGHLLFAARMSAASVVEVALILDDRDEAVADPEHRDSWREWLRLSNVLAFSTIPHTITTLQAIPAAPTIDLFTGPTVVPVAPDLTSDLPGGWADVDLDPEFTSPVVVALARLLAEAGVPPAESGAEVETGSVVDLSWPQRRIAVVLDDMPLAEIDEMTAAGWVVHRADGETDRLVAGIVSSMAEDGGPGSRHALDEIN